MNSKGLNMNGNTDKKRSIRGSAASFWGKIGRWWKGLKLWAKALVILFVVVAVGAIIALAHGKGAASTPNALPQVSVQSVGSLGSSSNGVYVTGKVQSVNEAQLLAQSAGTVTAVNTTLGANVPAGFVIASLDSSAAAASVLQAQGAYDSAVAAEQATNLQAQNSTGSLAEQQTSIQTAYQTDYTTTENTLVNQVDTFFGDNTPVGPQLLIEPGPSGDSLPRERASIKQLMANWQAALSTTDSTDSLTLLSSAQSYLTTVSSFLTDLSNVATQQGSGATPTQLADLATAQSTINGMLSGISTTRTAYNTAATSAAVGQTQSSDSSDSTVTSSEATVEQALGGLRAAQAAYEKTLIRAPLAGTVDYLQIHVGDYVSSNQHVATVARNNALQIVLELSQNDADRLAVGDIVTINSNDKGEVTTIAPALDPTTQEIEVDVAVNDGSDLVDGESVQVMLPALPAETATTATSTAATASSTNSVELPLTAVKLLPNERDVFSVDATGHLVAHQVTIGNVIGDRIQITSPLDPNLQIVTDARGLSAGDAVTVSTSTLDTDTTDDSDQ